jgi:hypothetical protein
VLCCLALLVNVLGVESPATYPLLLPLLQEALHPDSSQPELLEDGLGLWLVAARNAPSAEAGAPLLELTPALTACLTNSTGVYEPHVCPVLFHKEDAASCCVLATAVHVSSQ